MNSLDQIEFFSKDEMTCFRVRVQPRSGRNEIIGSYGQALKIRLKAPPLDGRANLQLQRFLANLLDLDKQHVFIIAGLRSRTKTVGILHLSRSELVDRLVQYLV
jgi:uncharacterized protein (TIGR00251 family)